MYVATALFESEFGETYNQSLGEGQIQMVFLGI